MYTKRYTTMAYIIAVHARRKFGPIRTSLGVNELENIVRHSNGVKIRATFLPYFRKKGALFKKLTVHLDSSSMLYLFLKQFSNQVSGNI